MSGQVLVSRSQYFGLKEEQMDQEVKSIKIKDLVLWTENPRDLINPDATDQDIVNKAFDDKLSKWSLIKLAKEMGNRYDFSELPTVVYEDGKPIVYDGNRRIRFFRTSREWPYI